MTFLLMIGAAMVWVVAYLAGVAHGQNRRQPRPFRDHPFRDEQ